jgi:hypothetical protein
MGHPSDFGKVLDHIVRGPFSPHWLEPRKSRTGTYFCLRDKVRKGNDSQRLLFSLPVQRARSRAGQADLPPVPADPYAGTRCAAVVHRVVLSRGVQLVVR